MNKVDISFTKSSYLTLTAIPLPFLRYYLADNQNDLALITTGQSLEGMLNRESYLKSTVILAKMIVLVIIAWVAIALQLK